MTPQASAAAGAAASAVAGPAPSLQTRLGPLLLPTPLSLASGTCGWGEELEHLLNWRAVGAIFTKGLSLLPRQGHPPPRIWETPSGMLNAIGLENVGLEAFVADKMPFLRRYRALHGGKVIVNLFGTTVQEYRELALALDGLDGVDGVEINLSCPNVQAGGIEFGRTPAGCEAVTSAVRGATQKFVAVKLSPASPVVPVAQACAAAGADALCMGNTMPSLCIDTERRISRLSSGVGGLSGPALRPINLRLVQQLHHSVLLPIVGCGGIATGNDAVEYLLAGATALQVGTATFADPNAIGTICTGLLDYLQRQQVGRVAELIGALNH